MGKLEDITGKKFSRLTVIERSYTDNDHFIRWKCICDCGNIVYKRAYPMKTGHIKSCGCLEKENRILIGNSSIHGLSKMPIYQVWKAMKSRCYRTTDTRYSRYGGRGISVCDEWLNNPEQFIKWSFENGYKEGLTIDRIDNNGNYSPMNCRFVSIAKNNRNSSNTHLTENDIHNIRYMYSIGSLQTIIAETYHVTQQTVSKIVNNKTWNNE